MRVPGTYSIILFSLGIIGEYLARMHYRLMEKPTFVIAQNISQASAGISSVNESVSQSSVSATNVTQDISEVNSLITEITKNNTKVDESSKEMTGLALKLKNQVNKFKY